MEHIVYNLMDIDLEKISQYIEAGELIVYPTDTVYGVGGSLYREDALKKIYTAKERNFNSPLIALVSDRKQINQVAELGQNREKIENLIKNFWPGALTIILNRNEAVPSVMVSGGDSIGVRMPNHPVAIDIIKACGGILPTTSANISGEASPRKFSEVSSKFKQRIAIVVDGGVCPVGIESTIIDMRATPKILREGGIKKEEIEKIIGKI